MNYSKTYFFDVESFSTFTCITFMEDKSHEIIQFKFGCGYNELQKFQDFLENKYLFVGFNNLSYDNAVIRYIQSLNNAKTLSKDVFGLSKRLISDENRRDEDVRQLRYPRDIYYAWEYLDLFKIMHFDRLGIGLKQIAINLKHDRIQDLPYPYDYPISTQEEVNVVLDYNVNDVLITEKLYYAIQPQLELRREISSLYNVDVMNASDSKMGNIILEHYYREDLGIDPYTLRDLRTKRTSVKLGDCIPAVISFETEELKDLHKRISDTTVFGFDNFKFEEKIRFRGVDYSIGSGGIHSMEKACRFDSTDKMKIMTCDIGSMYPTCIILNNIYPEHLNEGFVDILSTLTAERLASKKTNKVKAEALKITVNGLYGKLNSDTFWLEDAKAMLRVTIAGQLYILMLVEMLSLQGIKTISANTDGIESEVTIDKMDTYYSVCKEWQEKTGFILEFGEYKSYIKRDVNNYIAIGVDGKVKTKGAFIPQIDLKKGYKHPIVPKAVYEYFVNNIPVEETISSCKDIFDFCISQKVGKEFAMEYLVLKEKQQEMPQYSEVMKEAYLRQTGWTLDFENKWIKDSDENFSSFDLYDAFQIAWEESDYKERILETIHLQKTNRFFVSKTGGRLQKKNVNDGRIIGLFVGQFVQLLNEYKSADTFESYNVNLDWYIKEAKSMIAEIEPEATQADMFGFDMNFGKRMNLLGQQVTKKKRVALPKEITLKEIQESRQRKLTYEVPTTYALVTDVNTQWSPKIKFYSLAKGTETTFKIKKETFAENKLQQGDVVILHDFEERPKYKKEGNEFVPIPNQNEWWLRNYTVTIDISLFKRKNYV